MRGEIFSPHTPGIWVTEILNRYMCTETIGSPKFPRYPLYACNSPRRQTPVVNRTLAITQSVLLPSSFQRPSAFTPNLLEAIKKNDHSHRYIGAQYKACILNPSGFGFPLPGLPADFTTDLPAKLWSGGTRTHWLAVTNFVPNGTSEVVDLSRHDWNYLAKITSKYLCLL